MNWLKRLRRQASDPVVQAMEEALEAAKRGDHQTALALWEPLARSGVARAQNNIGACFAEGLGVEVDLALAEKWLALAAEAGDPVGQRNLAALHMRDRPGREPNYAEASRLYRLAATQGDAPAQDMLSWMLLEGEILPSDPQGARHWAEQAAAEGIASSMTRLGMLHHNAIGTERDPGQAARWWRMGAEGGDADGQAMLGAALHLGNGVAKDDTAAFSWLLRAQSGGSALATPFLPTVRAALSATEIAEAERQAALPLEPA
ncbi:tetratricopeptide repeat protein [Aureimonas psammosilenae]|uniref:tetratricopeptide repeat protein n=1 Tax=Aureimonas psammosilenae TaxID=2495496 RepID=UPI001261015B|nr:tetratricopeptide repeat protein [Aureimonas psammosilenae]